jgi:carotenoid cleavage dioxygenase-like enzyme
MSNVQATTTPTTAPAQPASARDPMNPYLQGNFGPVHSEQTHADLQVDGELPRELNGLLLRNGPNPLAPNPDKHHWFIGDAMLHAIEIGDGRARSYRSRFVRTPHVESELGLPAAPRSDKPLAMQGSGNVNVIEHAGKILALPEVGLPYELDHRLGTRREYDFAGALASSMTAHPKIDPVSGELHFFGYDFGPTHLRYHRASRDGRLDRTIEIKTPQPTMVHDFGVTATRIVFMDLPVVFDLGVMAQGYSMPFSWHTNTPARIGVLDRQAETDTTRWIEIDPCYVFHVLNAYDDESRIIMDVVRYDSMFDQSRIGPFEPNRPSKLVRWTIDPEAGTVQEMLLDATAQEFPRVDPRRETLPHRYGYGLELEFGSHSVTFRGLLKHDLHNGTRERHDVGSQRSAGEGVFVPRGGGEDEGFVLTAVYDASTDRSDILVIDAQNFTKAPLATIHLPVRVPYGFHGNFVSPSALG